MPSTKPPLITGEIVIEDVEFSKLIDYRPNCKIVVQLEDITVADTSSMVIASQTIERRDFAPHGDSDSNITVIIPFELFYEIKDKQRRYAISVHVDMDGDNKVSQGDYINTQSYPVITQGYPTQISVKVIRID